MLTGRPRAGSGETSLRCIREGVATRGEIIFIGDDDEDDDEEEIGDKVQTPPAPRQHLALARGALPREGAKAIEARRGCARAAREARIAEEIGSEKTKKKKKERTERGERARGDFVFRTSSKKKTESRHTRALSLSPSLPGPHDKLALPREHSRCRLLRLSRWRRL